MSTRVKRVSLFFFSTALLLSLSYCGGNGGQPSSTGGQTGSTKTGTPALFSQSIVQLSDNLTRYTWSIILAGTYAPTRREEYCSRYSLCTGQGRIYPFIVEHLQFHNGPSGTLTDGTGDLSVFGLLQPVGSNLLGGSLFDIPFKITRLDEDIQNNTFDMSLEADISSSIWAGLSPQLQTAFQFWNETFTDISFPLPGTQPPFIFDTKDRLSYTLVFAAKDLHSSMQDLLLHQKWETLARPQDRADMCHNNPVFCFDPATKAPFDVLVEHLEFAEDPKLPGFILTGTVYYYGLMGTYTSGQTPLPSTPTFEASFQLGDAVYPSGVAPLIDLEWIYDAGSSWAGGVARLQKIKWVSTGSQDKFECLTGPSSTQVKRTYTGI